MKRITWTRPAMADLEQLATFWEAHAPKRWEAVLNAILAKVVFLETNPLLGQQEPRLSELRPDRSYRYVLADRYKIIYRVSGEAIIILQVFDTRMSPDKMRG